MNLYELKTARANGFNFNEKQMLTIKIHSSISNINKSY